MYSYLYLKYYMYWHRIYVQQNCFEQLFKMNFMTSHFFQQLVKWNPCYPTNNINLSKPSGFFTYHQVKQSKFYMVLALLWVFCTDLRTESNLYFYVINWLLFITVVEIVYSAVRTDSLYKADYVSSYLVCLGHVTNFIMLLAASLHSNLPLASNTFFIM
jgi:hypothetical protein